MSRQGDTVDGSSLIAASFARWAGEPRLERDVFETTAPGRLVAVVEGFCREHLRAGVAAYEFFSSSVGSVHGLRLADGRRVVLKAHRREADLDHLAAIQRVQGALADAGFPAPRPLLAPTPIAQGIAVVETLIDEGERADGHDPLIRRAVAAGLVRLIEAARSVATPCGLMAWRDASEGLWQRPTTGALTSRPPRTARDGSMSWPPRPAGSSTSCGRPAGDRPWRLARGAPALPSRWAERRL